MSYHDTSSNTGQGSSSAQRQPAPDGFHYMPDGTLMSDAEHARLYGENPVPCLLYTSPSPRD